MESNSDNLNETNTGSSAFISNDHSSHGNGKNNLLLIITAIIILLLVGGGSYYLGSRQNNSFPNRVQVVNTVNPTTSPEINNTPTPQLTADNRKSYTNSKFKYSVKYPLGLSKENRRLQLLLVR